jgi:hypothetical protein
MGCPATDIKEAGFSSAHSISVFPNPFSMQTTIQTDRSFKDATLTVYNLYGQQVKQLNNISGQTVTLQRDNLPGGLYFISITQSPSPEGEGLGEVIATKKLVITDK